MHFADISPSLKLVPKSTTRSRFTCSGAFGNLAIMKETFPKRSGPRRKRWRFRSIPKFPGTLSVTWSRQSLGFFADSEQGCHVAQNYLRPVNREPISSLAQNG